MTDTKRCEAQTVTGVQCKMLCWNQQAPADGEQYLCQIHRRRREDLAQSHSLCRYVDRDGVQCVRVSKDMGDATRCANHRRMHPHRRCIEPDCTKWIRSSNTVQYCRRHGIKHSVWGTPSTKIRKLRAEVETLRQQLETAKLETAIEPASNDVGSSSGG